MSTSCLAIVSRSKKVNERLCKLQCLKIASKHSPLGLKYITLIDHAKLLGNAQGCVQTNQGVLPLPHAELCLAEKNQPRTKL